jgi:hypothetical protein
LIIQVASSAQIIATRDQINRVIVILFVYSTRQIIKLVIFFFARIEQLVWLELNIVLLPVDYFVYEVIFAYFFAHLRRATAVIRLQTFIAQSAIIAKLFIAQLFLLDIIPLRA